MLAHVGGLAKALALFDTETERQRMTNKTQEQEHTGEPGTTPDILLQPPAEQDHAIVMETGAIEKVEAPEAPETPEAPEAPEYNEITLADNDTDDGEQDAQAADVLPYEAQPEEQEDETGELCCVTEARIELSQNHALLTFGSLIESLGKGFRHTVLVQNADDAWLFDEYVNDCFLVTYCINTNGRDQLRVRWVDPIAEEAHNDGELPALARYLARSLGGGTNLHLIDCSIRVKRNNTQMMDEEHG